MSPKRAPIASSAHKLPEDTHSAQEIVTLGQGRVRASQARASRPAGMGPLFTPKLSTPVVFMRANRRGRREMLFGRCVYVGIFLLVFHILCSEAGRDR